MVKGKKPHIVIDECLQVLLKPKFLNSLEKVAKVFYSAELIGYQGAEDKLVYQISNKNECHVLTANLRDFKKYPRKKKDVGVIGMNPNFNDQIIKKLIELLRIHSQDYFYQKTIEIKQR